MSPLADLTLAVLVNPGDTYVWSKLLLAKATFHGTLELLTAAWESVLGYGLEEFKGKTLCQLMPPNGTSASDAVAAILDERSTDPVDMTLLCRDGAGKRFRLHRRFDEYLPAMFILAEVTHPAVVLQPLRPPTRLAR